MSKKTLIITSAFLAALAALIGPFLWAFFVPGSAQVDETHLPWQVKPTADGGSEVFGLQFGTSTLADARRLFGDDAQTAIVAPPGGKPLLESYFESVRAGYITGKLVLTAEVDAAHLDTWRERAAKVEYMESATRKYTLAADDLQAAMAAPVAAIAFIPSANLDEDIVLQRFGQPAQRIRVSDDLEHFLYPDKGLDLALHQRQREVLQYVAPRDFARLQAPLAPSPATATTHD